ncbi:Oidioi.mRNA.OKI2018_I69.chr1.g2306.t1.cds [Oikopleura dioica]|uniref:Oidioi.mRNA.OKI2018_I69.chr1.g2306.t1.cds n=1 Tax=Oikopleura dioica TaxID=34765 RepID=A0ABN7SV02_OIKDI|nr:Oidioi.mRNA.OKI2018_I69.chr1.g2306.t1.cds [Oikopleura dioica]
MSDGGSDEEWEVEALLDHRNVDEDGNKLEETEYRIRWVGFPPDDDTWEPRKNLESSLHLIDEYEKKIKRRAQRRKEKRQRRAKLYNYAKDDLPGMPVLNLDMDLDERPLQLPRDFDENKWELAEPFMCPFCGKLTSSHEGLRIHQQKCRPLKKVVEELKKMRPSRQPVDDSSNDEEEAPEMDELASPQKKTGRAAPGSDEEMEAQEFIAKEMGMNVMRVEEEKSEGQQMPSMSELEDQEMSVDQANMTDDEKAAEEENKGQKPPVGDEKAIETPAGEESEGDKIEEELMPKPTEDEIAETTVGSSADEEYKQFLHSPPKACSTQLEDGASGVGISIQIAATEEEGFPPEAEPTSRVRPESPPASEVIDEGNDVYEEVVETTEPEEPPAEEAPVTVIAQPMGQLFDF